MSDFIETNTNDDGIGRRGFLNVANIQEGGLGILGQEQLDWLEKDVKSLSPDTRS